MYKFLIKQLARSDQSAKLLIFNFHNILPDDDNSSCQGISVSCFEQQVLWLKKHFEILPLQKAIADCRAGKLIKPTACITFDDGYKSHATIAAPILKKHGASASFYVSSGHLNDVLLWNDWLYLFFKHVKTMDWTEFHNIVTVQCELSSEQSKQLNRSQLESLVKYLPLAKRKKVIEVIQTFIPQEFVPTLMMSESDVRWLKNEGFEIGSHTLEHPILAKETKEEAERQITRDIGNLSEILSEPVLSFAFPNGKPQFDYHSFHTSVLARNRIKVGLSSAIGHFSPGYDPMQVSRVCLYGDSELGFLRSVISAYRSSLTIINSRGYEKAD